MNAFISMVLDRGAATLSQIEGAMETQLLYGGHLGTNLMEIGALHENALHRLLAEFHALPVGPHGRLPDLSDAMEELIPKELALRTRVYPVKRTRRTLHVAVQQPLEAEVENELRKAVPMQLRPVIVTPLRLHEALWRHFGLPLTERDKRLLLTLEEGEIRPRMSPFAQEQGPESWMPASPIYRRMTEEATRVVPASEQPRRSRRRLSARLRSTSGPPDTLEGVGPGVLASDGDLDSAPPSSGAGSDFAADSDASDGLRRSLAAALGSGPAADSQPPTSWRGQVGGNSRNTQPWRDDEEAEPGSLHSELVASLTSAPHESEAPVREAQYTFRHRGPFTRAQAELAASQAGEVQIVLEILMRYARQFFERSMLFVVQGEEAQLRLVYGMTPRDEPLAIALSEESVLRDAVESGDPLVRALVREGVDSQLRRDMAVGDQPVAVIPLQIRERVIALFYGDDRSDDVDVHAMADVTDFTEVCAGEITRVIIALKRAKQASADS